MPFLCPDCRALSLQITHRLEIPPDRDWDEITLQTIRCSTCGLKALAVYKESRRGALDSEVWRHTGYNVDENTLDQVIAALEACPSPTNPDCLCPSHRHLGRINEQLSWDWLESVRIIRSFELQH